jgi:hypothetical protein
LLDALMLGAVDEGQGAVRAGAGAGAGSVGGGGGVVGEDFALVGGELVACKVGFRAFLGAFDIQTDL